MGNPLREAALRELAAREEAKMWDPSGAPDILVPTGRYSEPEVKPFGLDMKEGDFDQDSGDKFLSELQKVADTDVAILNEKKKEYGNSWKSRGGIGAFMMLARKWDRIENMLKQHGGIINRSRLALPNVEANPYDIFRHLQVNSGEDGVFDDIGDLRRYLMLVEAEMRARGWTPKPRKSRG